MSTYELKLVASNKQCIDMSDYQKLTVVKLKELLKERGLTVAGKKADLIERLERDESETELADRRVTDVEVEVVSDQPVVNGEEAAQLSPEKEAAEAPVVAQIPEPAVAHEEEPQLIAEKGVNEESAAIQAPETTATNDASKESPPTKTQSLTNQEAFGAGVQAQNDAADVNEESVKVQAKQEAGLDTLDDQQVGEVAEEFKKDVEDAGMETIQETNPETRLPLLNDSGIMPAPELPASQIPRPSIETQQTLESRDGSHTVEPNSAMEGITRTTTMSSVNTQELLEDRMKRKRRSHSPPVSSADVAIKKAKAADGSPRATLIQDGQDSLPTRDSAEDGMKGKHDYGRIQSPDLIEDTAKGRDRDLLSADDQAQDTKSKPEHDSQSATPSRHSATNCLYIGNLMRPLQPTALRAHLEKLAGSKAEDDVEAVGLFFLESTRRYGVASFSSVATASRVRSGLHDRVWPDESNRKALFVDFIPEDKANELIELEENNANKPRLERKRYEIQFVEQNGKVIPEIHNADSSAATQYRTGQTLAAAASTNLKKPSTQSTLPPPPREETGKNFKALDDLFPSTAAKPRLYYLPSSSKVAERRLEALSRATATREETRKPTSLVSEEKRRYTFEDGDIVDKGPEYGLGRGGNSARGRAGGGGPGERGSYRNRGGRGGGGPRNDYRSGAGIGYHDRW